MRQVGCLQGVYRDAGSAKRKINENPSSRSLVVRCGRTDIPDETNNRFSQFLRTRSTTVSATVSEVVVHKQTYIDGRIDGWVVGRLWVLLLSHVSTWGSIAYKSVFPSAPEATFDNKHCIVPDINKE